MASHYQYRTAIALLLALGSSNVGHAAPQIVSNGPNLQLVGIYPTQQPWMLIAIEPSYTHCSIAIEPSYKSLCAQMYTKFKATTSHMPYQALYLFIFWALCVYWFTFIFLYLFFPNPPKDNGCRWRLASSQWQRIASVHPQCNFFGEVEFFRSERDIYWSMCLIASFVEGARHGYHSSIFTHTWFFLVYNLDSRHSKQRVHCAGRNSANQLKSIVGRPFDCSGMVICLRCLSENCCFSHFVFFKCTCVPRLEACRITSLV